MTPVRLKIDEVLTADRVCPQGCGQRGRPAGMRAEGTACRDAGSAPTRQADGIRRIHRAATIFPPGAWVAREAAVSLHCTFTGISASEK